MKQREQKETRYYDTFRDFLTDISIRYGERTAITTYRRGSEISERSYSRLKEDSYKLARWLFEHDLNGRHIAIVSDNSYEWLITYFGIVCAGGTAVCVDIEHSDEVIGEMLKRADSEAVFCSACMSNVCAAICRESNQIRAFVTMNGNNVGDYALSEILAEQDSEAAGQAFDALELKSDMIATIVYTSGTTSTAKPVMLSHSAILYNAADSLTLLDSRDRVFNSLPLYHMYGFTCGTLCGLIRGLNVCLSCDLKRIKQELENFRPGMLVAVPLIIEVIYKMIRAILDKDEGIEEDEGKSWFGKLLRKSGTSYGTKVRERLKGSAFEFLDVILTGGACLDLSIEEKLESYGIVVLQGYGATECSPSISCNRNEDYSLDSVGVILPGNEVRISEENEILVRGYALMSGYYKDPETTAEAFDKDWFKTGDLGYFDKKGQLRITGRMKNLIVMKNGQKVSAEEIESRFRDLPLVKDAMAYGASCGESKDDVKIAVSIYPDPELTAGMSRYEILERLQECVDEINTKMPLYKKVQMIHLRSTQFERTSSMKLVRTNEF